MKDKHEHIAPEKVIIKLSICQKCSGIVRQAVKHMMSVKSKNEFLKEVMNYNLSVVEKTLPEFQKEENKWCKC